MQIRPRAAALVHLGDTSFRRKEVISDYHAVIRTLRTFRTRTDAWDATAQGEFYDLLRLEAPEVFGRSLGDGISASDAQKRARTYTNALVKLGFADDARRVTGLGTMFASATATRLDRFDALCHLKPENSAVLRGVLSFTEATDDGRLFFPGRLLLAVLGRLGPLSTDEFALVFIAGPQAIGIDVDALVDAVQRMRSESLPLAAALLTGAQHSDAREHYVYTGLLDAEVFPNRKGDTYVQRYRAFVEALTAFREHPDGQRLETLRRAIKDGAGTVRSRFDPAQYLPALKDRSAGPAKVHGTACYPAFHGADEDFRSGLLALFDGGRTLALVGEYLDNNLRILTATGVLSVAGDQVSISSAYAGAFVRENAVRLALFTDSPVTAPRRADGLVALLGPEAIETTGAAIAAAHGIAPEDIQDFIDAQDLQRFDRIISAAFPPTAVLDYLQRIGEDYQSPDLGTDLAAVGLGKTTVPCAYEYLIGLSFYYVSGRSFDPRIALGLSLDGDFLPISHAPGGRGDIEFTHAGRRVLVEVTLMDPATQRRGELEPVLRHATNLACEFPDDEVLTVFIANEVDPNVARIFGFARVMEMSPTDGGGGTASPLIVSLRTRDWHEIASGTATLDAFLDVITAEAEHTEIAHLNSEWNAALVDRLRSL